MSCSLKLHKDNLEDLDIISKFSTIKDKSKLIKYGKATMNAYNEKHGMVDHLGNPFFVNYIGKGKEKVVFNKIFFEAIDQLENAVFFKENAISEAAFRKEIEFKEQVEGEDLVPTDESIFSQNESDKMQEVYSRIDAMLESNEITITCKI